MKISEILRFPALVLGSIIFIVLFTSYGNKKVHPDFNTLMVDSFLNHLKSGEFDEPEYANYKFDFGAEASKLKGIAVTQNGYFSAGDVSASGFGLELSDESEVSLSPREWIIHGGFSADVPEVPASLRHFYDPTRSAGDRYLTDIANSRILGSAQKYVFTNPHIDGVEWALGKPGELSAGVQDHYFNWERGKAWIILALKESNTDKRNEFMAKAWRSLGETLHMIADNGCPAHVRNDAHPAPTGTITQCAGNPDPYEELVDVIKEKESSEFLRLAKGMPNEAYKEQFIASKSTFEIAHTLAVFTNTNFVTNETISGTSNSGYQIQQIAHPDHTYSSPLLNSMIYEKSDNSYNSPFGIKQCVENYYLKKLTPQLCTPYVDMACVKSQAEVLFPMLIEAGANVIKLFIPKLTIEVKPIEQGLLNGEIKHKKDKEYPNEIKYSGEVILIIKDGKNKEKEKIIVQAKEGKFEQKDFFLENDEYVTAVIEFGGVKVESASVIYTGAWMLYGKNTSFLSNGKPHKLIQDQYLGSIIFSDLENNTQYRKVSVSKQGSTIILRCEGSVNNLDSNSLDIFTITNVSATSIEGTCVSKYNDVIGNKTETHFTLYGKKVQ